MKRAGLVALAVALGVTRLLPEPWRTIMWVVLTVVLVVAMVLLVRAIRRDPGFVAESGYEHHRQTPEHVRDEGVAIGTVLPEKRLPRA